MLTLPCSAVAAAVAQVAMVALAAVEEVETMGRTKGSTWLRAAPALAWASWRLGTKISQLGPKRHLAI